MTGELRYPILCLTRELGVCVVRDANELSRCRAVVFWRGRFYEGLRLVDSEGRLHEVVRIRILKPRSRLGTWLTRFLDLSVSVEVETEPSGTASLGEIEQAIRAAVEEDAESVEEFSGHSVEWWEREVANSRTVADLLWSLRAATEDR